MKNILRGKGNFREGSMRNKNLLLHICCGVCSIHSFLKLRSQGFSVVGFFYNPNIHPREEYLRRWNVARDVAEKLNFTILEAEYDPQHWFHLVKGLEEEKEGGKRCHLCFRMRLEHTYQKMKELGFIYRGVGRGYNNG